MKKLFTFLILSCLLLTSCDTEKIKVENPIKETTVEIQSLAKLDTNTYKVIFIKNDVYMVNTKTNLVDYKNKNNTRGTNTAMLFLFTMLIIVLIALIIITEH